MHHWSREEEDFIRQHWTGTPENLAFLSRSLGRSLLTISRRAKKIKCCNAKNVFIDTEIYTKFEDMFGVKQAQIMLEQFILSCLKNGNKDEEDNDEDFVPVN